MTNNIYHTQQQSKLYSTNNMNEVDDKKPRLSNFIAVKILV